MDVSHERFAQYLAERLPADRAPEEALAEAHIEDLFLCCGCVDGERRALTAFSGRYLDGLDRVLARLRAPASVISEVKQVLSEQLLTARGSSPPKLAAFTGEGSLAGWLRIAATREALRLMRKGRREVPAEEELLAARPVDEGDVELDYVKRAHQKDFREAFLGALKALTSRQRNVLRYHYARDLSIDQISAIYHVHRATAARWIAGAREQLAVQTHALLAQRLGLTPEESTSLLRALRSGLEMTFRQLSSEGEG